MSEEENKFPAFLEKAEKMTEAELHVQRRQYEPGSSPYRAYDLELQRRTAEKLDRLTRRAAFCAWSALALSIASFIVLILLLVKR
jgi:hypothetical protein